MYHPEKTKSMHLILQEPFPYWQTALYVPPKLNVAAEEWTKKRTTHDLCLLRTLPRLPKGG